MKYHQKIATSIFSLPRLGKRALAIALDVALCALTGWIAFSLRLETWGLSSAAQWIAVAASIALAVPIFTLFGVYHTVFRYAGWAAFMVILRAMLVYSAIYILIFTLISVPEVPRSVGILQPLLLLVFVTISRALVRYWLGNTERPRMGRREKPKVLVYGAGAAGRQLVAAMTSSHEMQVIGFLDDDRRLTGCIMQGITIYNPQELETLVAEQGITDVLLALPSVTRKRRNEILARMTTACVKVRTLPGLMDIAHGRIEASDIRELDVEDLLGREPVPPNPALIGRMIKERTVMVTGAGGSIGSELCRQILANAPAKLLLVEMSEYALYAIHQELQRRLSDLKIAHIQLVPLLGSVRDERRMQQIMSLWCPQTVYHAAAYKHVPLVELNPAEGIQNNVFGTYVTAKVAAQCGVRDFVLISTDKAVRPTNIMGASKRLAEMVLQALAQQGQAHNEGSTRYSMVRFGNVLGSSGSVVPLFRQQIREGGPITLTHADITRYFMTIPEAAQLVIQAGAMAKGGDVFVLDMGEPVKIIDLARRMVELSGLSVVDAGKSDGDIEIRIMGLRPGEKLYEELLIGDNPQKSDHPRIMVARERFLPFQDLQPLLVELEAALDCHDLSQIMRLMRQLVPEYLQAANIEARP